MINRMAIIRGIIHSCYNPYELNELTSFKSIKSYLARRKESDPNNS